MLRVGKGWRLATLADAVGAGVFTAVSTGDDTTIDASAPLPTGLPPRRRARHFLANSR